MVNINEIHPRGCDLHHGFIGLGLWNWNVYKFEGFGAARLPYLNGFHVRLD
jgi:hypothetical protein